MGVIYSSDEPVAGKEKILQFEFFVDDASMQGYPFSREQAQELAELIRAHVHARLQGFLEYEIETRVDYIRRGCITVGIGVYAAQAAVTALNGVGVVAAAKTGIAGAAGIVTLYGALRSSLVAICKDADGLLKWAMKPFRASPADKAIEEDADKKSKSQGYYLVSLKKTFILG